MGIAKTSKLGLLQVKDVYIPISALRSSLAPSFELELGTLGERITGLKKFNV